MTSITEEQMEELGVELDAEVRSYSGRGMYGAECFAIVIDQYDSMWQVAITVGQLSESDMGDLEEALDHLHHYEPRQDSMGLGSVYYWPWLKIEEDNE